MSKRIDPPHIIAIQEKIFTPVGTATSGTLYIVDTFLVVVFGGAASLLGTVASAFVIAQGQSLLEFFLGASMAKVSILLAVIVILMRVISGRSPL